MDLYFFAFVLIVNIAILIVNVVTWRKYHTLTHRAMILNTISLVLTITVAQMLLR